MKQILFVDDDASILESLRDALRPWRREWRSTFACGGEAALELLAADSFDVVVSDMRMPGVDGATLLRQVGDLQPHAVRIMLTGSTEADVLARAAAVAHRFLAKPCEAEELAHVLTDVLSFGDPSTRQCQSHAVSAATTLPCAPALYGELSELLASETAGVADVARLIERDVAVTAKVLQLTNSAFFGLGRTVVRIDEAVNLLGLGIVKAIVLSTHALAAYRPARPVAGFSIEALEAHSLAVARLARRLLPAGAAQEQACAAAMLHDIGWLVLAAEDPDHLGAVLAAAQDQGRPLDVVERELSGPTHAELGAHLFALWGLPDPIVAAVANHHAPAAPTEPGIGVIAAVHIADALILEQSEPFGERLDTDYLKALGVADRLDAWRALAGEMLSQPPAGDLEQRHT